MIEKLKAEIVKASYESGSNKLIYEINFWFGMPAHSLKILGLELFRNHDIPGGFDGIGEKDLIVLEKDGFLKRISETINEQDPLEKIIEYEIVFQTRPAS